MVIDGVGIDCLLLSLLVVAVCLLAFVVGVVIKCVGCVVVAFFLATTVFLRSELSRSKEQLMTHKNKGQALLLLLLFFFTTK